jgi:succinate dehydrogenase/fumarate reductase flavoprotein subunit
MARQENADVLVIGAGMAGLCAAISALEQGASVLVIEKGTRTGGSMWLSNGLIWTFADKTQVREEIPDGHEALQDFLVDGLPDSLDWLASQGVELEPEQAFQWYGRGRLSNAAQMAPALAERVASLGGRLLLNTAMQTLITAEGAVTGVQACDAEGVLQITAKSVILASGGFQGNAELLTRYITPHAACMYLRSNPCSTGDGFTAAVDIGAAVTPLINAFYGHALIAPPARFNAFEFQDMSQKYGPLSVALNREGRRFTDESAGTGEENLNFHIAQQTRATAVYIVDAAIAQMSSPDNPPPFVAISRARKAGGPVVEADTLEELAEKIQAWGISSVQVLASLAEYNAAAKAGRADRLQPARRKNAFPIEQGPFTAVLVRAGITYTCGGLQADLDMRVLGRASSISMLPMVTAHVSEMRIAEIPNLYVAGCDLGGISNWGYMGGLSQALVTGRTAGATAASGRS